MRRKLASWPRWGFFLATASVALVETLGKLG